MNGVFKHLTQQIELTANSATKEFIKPLNQLLKGFTIYYELFMKQSIETEKSKNKVSNNLINNEKPAIEPFNLEYEKNDTNPKLTEIDEKLKLSSGDFDFEDPNRESCKL